MNYSKDKNIAFNIIKKHKIKILLKEPKNNECFECSSLYPKYISLNNGIFICKDCSKIHLNFPKTISNIIKNDLNNLTLKNIQYLCCGGNRKLTEFINKEYPNLKNLSRIYFYQTYAMDYYRKYLIYLIEGGIKPVKPQLDKAYDLITINHLYIENLNKNNINDNGVKGENVSKNNSVNVSMMNNNSYIKINKSTTLFPKIKPIIGRNNENRFTRSLSRHNKLNRNEFNLTSSNFNNNNYLNNSLNEEKYNSTSTDFKYRHYSHFKYNYDTDENYEDINDIRYINENELNEQINDMSNINDLDDLEIKIEKKPKEIKIQNRINRRNRDDTNIKVFKINHNSTSNLNSNIYSRPLYQTSINTFQDNFNNDNKTYLNNENIFNISQINNNNLTNQIKRKQIYSIEDLRNYLSNNNNIYKSRNNFPHKEKYIYNLKQNLNNNNLLIENLNIKNKQTKDSKQNNNNFNNINNNIITNRNLNVFYSNNNNNLRDVNLQRIFKKKALGNSFSINEKKKNLKLNYSIDKSKVSNSNFFITTNDEENIIKIKKKIKIRNEWKKKLCNKIIEKNNENTFIKVNKINHKLKPIKKIKSINNISFEHNYLNLNNNDKINLKSKIIERISRVIQKEKDGKKSTDKIKVNKNDNKIKEKQKNLNNTNFNYIGVTNIQKKGKEKEKHKMKNKSFNDKRVQINKSSNNILETQKRKLVLMKELVNIPFGKRRTILEIIKSNNIANKSVSPSAKRILEIYTNQKNYPKNELNNNSLSPININVRYKEEKIKKCNS